MIGDHPDIVSMEKTGYPTWNQPESIYCDECGTCLDDKDVYEDRYHSHLCRECLCMLHEKVW